MTKQIDVQRISESNPKVDLHIYERACRDLEVLRKMGVRPSENESPPPFSPAARGARHLAGRGS